MGIRHQHTASRSDGAGFQSRLLSGSRRQNHQHARIRRRRAGGDPGIESQTGRTGERKRRAHQRVGKAAFGIETSGETTFRQKGLNYEKQTVRTLVTLALLSTLNFQLSAFAQGTAFTYQGRLSANGSPANGLFGSSAGAARRPVGGH